MSAGVSRNDPCPCGSNKKYKNCHGRSGFHLRITAAKKVFLLLVVLAAIAWAGKEYIFGDKLTGDSSGPLSGQQSGRVQPLVPQPPGPVPEGKVWSPEHGHWHNAPVNFTDSSGVYHPKPSGLTPPGKVWSYDHGHWHDTSYTGTETFSPGPPPPGPPPEGKVWSYDHGHWHDAPQGQPVDIGVKKGDKINVSANALDGIDRTKSDKPEEKNAVENEEGVTARPKGTIIQ